MRRFILKLCLFSIPILLYVVADLSFSDNLAYRPWEALAFHTDQKMFGLYYPNQEMRMTSVGDLCHHSDNAIQKPEYWQTDALGYRNDSVIDNADILLIGDSFFTGTGQMQENTMANALSRHIDNSIYSMAPSSIEEFDNLYRSGILKKPKVIVLAQVERFPLPPIDKGGISSDTPEKVDLPKANILVDKARKLFLLRYGIARVTGSTGPGVKGEEGMFFLNKDSQSNRKISEVEEETRAILSYKNYCENIGIKFVYLPMANKETIYYDMAGLKPQPPFLNELYKSMVKRGINTLPMVDIYNQARQSEGKLLYHKDDTHWNKNGTDLIASNLSILLSQLLNS